MGPVRWRCVESEISAQRSDWGPAAQVTIYLGRRVREDGLVGTEQWPVDAVVWVVDVADAGLVRAGSGVVDRVVLVHDAETGEPLAYLESAPRET